ncbi:LLM class flavin-dependent oxidoreductase [Herbaspirillum sp. LeCh32-8]|uniref:LLM class flavin-dependent oxidoreductase n=1 Tax=Herbaspirillum sp. LeCh32-8 TaxID=2821356 RepID=UPI001AEABE54|nr:LLM class flavin-dependent oxidoreductase [Herbaspirillum sp. LeCh32-8]MBP0598140.1 LLM class flavin-dependent oxidoreductase [Herbaspirillum sp. LeCh32-8]
MHLAAFLIAGNAAHSQALWRHPQSRRGGFLELDYYRHIAQTLERGKFDLLFFADRLAVSTRYGENHRHGIAVGDQDATRLDPLPLLGALAAVTQHIGLGATRSTTYSQPYSLAREFATLDHLSGGRAAWNVVTSVNQGEADNFGLKETLPHDVRYDRADEFLELTHKLWRSWQPDALRLEGDGAYADPGKVEAVDHRGAHFSVRGPLNIPATPQRSPVIIQAGSSDRGQDFAARWAEVVFNIQPDLGRLQGFYGDLKGRAQQFGRRAQDIKILSAVMPFVGRSRAHAEELREEANGLADPLVGLSTLSSHMNVDFSAYAPDAPIGDVQVSGIQGLFKLLKEISAERQLTLADAARLYAQGVLTPQVAGTAADVADWLEDIVAQGGADGFVISPSHLPHGFDDFVDGVVPELQRRGSLRKQYQGNSLREHLRG